MLSTDSGSALSRAVHRGWLRLRPRHTALLASAALALAVGCGSSDAGELLAGAGGSGGTNSSGAGGTGGESGGGQAGSAVGGRGGCPGDGSGGGGGSP